MEYQEILNRLAPCGIRCDTCFAFKDGRINQLSRELAAELGNFQNYAARFSEVLEEPVFNAYPYFKLQLDFFTKCDCRGCRNERCKLLKTCNVRLCTEKKKVDFCFQCDEFPCYNSGFDENLELRWKKTNQQLKDKGVEAFFEESRDDHRYP